MPRYRPRRPMPRAWDRPFRFVYRGPSKELWEITAWLEVCRRKVYEMIAVPW